MTKPKIYRCEVKTTLYIAASSAQEAFDRAPDFAQEEIGNGSAKATVATEILQLHEVEQEWRYCLPYLASKDVKDEKTLEQWLSSS